MRGLEGSWRDRVTFLRKGVQEPGTTDVMEALHFPVVPSVIVVDGGGNERARFMGYMSAPDLDALLKKLMVDSSGPVGKVGTPTNSRATGSWGL